MPSTLVSQIHRYKDLLMTYNNAVENYNFTIIIMLSRMLNH
ncbi:hypothetical protein [Streptococcus pluranimalium]